MSWSPACRLAASLTPTLPGAAQRSSSSWKTIEPTRRSNPPRIHDVIHGENARAYITLREGSERPTDLELIRFARAKVGYKAPEEIVVLDEMPRTATGKVDRTGLKRMAESALHEIRG